MADEERKDEGAEQPEDGAEQPEDGAEQPEGEGAEQPDEGAAQSEQPEEGTEQPDEPPAAEEPERDAPAAKEEEEKKKEEAAVPGAELEPIALEPERPLSAEERARLEAEAEERASREAEATAEAGDEEPARRKAVDLPTDARIQATGKRKSSIARVIVRAGKGGFDVNDRSLDEYFPRAYLQALVRQPLLAAGYEEAVDVRVRVHGGGVSGQAGAVRHGIARALCEIDPELRGELKRRGLLTRDDRRKERRKAGLKKARKRPQFSKR